MARGIRKSASCFLLCSGTARRVRKKTPTAGADRCFCPMQTSTVGADRCVCPKAIVRVILKERLRLKDLECVSLSVYYSVALNLYTVIVYSFCSLSLLTFCRAKSYKNARHTEKQPFAPSVRELRCNITHPPFTYRLCLSFQSREQKNSLHALPTSHGAHAQTLLFFFLYWN